MAYAFDPLKVLVSAVMLAACTGENPLFMLETETSTGGASTQADSDGSETTSGAPTSDTPTSAGPTSDASSEPGTSGPQTSTGPVTTEPATSGSTSGMTTDPAEGFCGDGELNMDLGEECDAGMDNGNGGLCSPKCKLNICGDGYAAEDEKCDDGELNGMGSACTKDCVFTTCGDAYKGGDEKCDSGDANGTGVGFCSHDCLELIEEAREICVTQPIFLGKLYDGQFAGIAGADGLCGQKCGMGYKAMVVGEARVASVTPYKGDGDGWVLQPYTAYTRVGGAPTVFVTGKERLLGVIAGGDAPLLAPLNVNVVPVWTGLKADWTNAPNNCTNWGAKDMNGNYGDSSQTTLSKYIAKGEQACVTPAAIYCAQQ